MNKIDEFFNELHKLIETANNNMSGEKVKIDNNTHIYDVLGNLKFLIWYDTLSGNIAIDLGNSFPMIYKNLKEFFHTLEKYDKGSVIKAFLYLKGVTEDTTNEQLFN